MGARNSKLDGQAGMLKGWVTPRAVFLSHRRQPPPSGPTSTDVHLLPSPEIPTDMPIVCETDSKHINDDTFEEQDQGLVDDKDKYTIGVDGQGDKVESEEEEEKEEGYAREDMIRRWSISPSFRVYCLESDDQEEEVEDDDDGGASVDSDPTMTPTILSRQSSHNSNDEGLIKTPRRRRRRRRLMQKDMFNGVGKNFLNLKLPHHRHHHRSISTGTIDDHRSHRHHFQLPRISYRKSIGGSKHHDPQHPGAHEGSSHHDSHHRHHHHQLSLPNVNSHQNIIDDDDDNNNNQDPRTTQGYQANDNVNHSHNNGHHLMKLPHISHHSSNDDVNNNHRTSNVVEISNSFYDGDNNDDDNRHTYDDVVDHDHQHHNNHKLKLPCIHDDDDDDINHHHSHNHLKHVLPQVSCWRNTRRQSRRGKTRHHG